MGKRPLLPHSREGIRVGQNQSLLHSEARLPRDVLARFGDRGTLVGLPDKIEGIQLNLNFR